MKSVSLPATLLFGMVALYSCTNAPESDQATTTDAKAVTQDSAGQKWTINTGASTIEWVGTKVTGYHTGMVPLKSGELTVKDGAVTGGRFVLDVAHLTVSGPKSMDSASINKLTGHLKSADFFDVEKNPEGIFELTAVEKYSGAAVKDSTDDRQEQISKYRLAINLCGVSKNVHELMHSYDLFLMSSSFEGHPLALLEAMACGMPVAVSDIPVLREATAGKAIYFDLNNVDDFVMKVKDIADHKIDLNGYANDNFEIASKIAAKDRFIDTLKSIYSKADLYQPFQPGSPMLKNGYIEAGAS